MARPLFLRQDGTVATQATATIRIRLPPAGRLKGADVLQTTTTQGPQNASQVTLYIIDTGLNQSSVLKIGYTGGTWAGLGEHVYWTGDLPINADIFLRANIFNGDSVTQNYLLEGFLEVPW